MGPGHNSAPTISRPSRLRREFPRPWLTRWLSLEHLEDRSVPSAYYDLTTTARTGGPEGFTQFGDLVSMNDSGAVAFVGYTDRNGNQQQESGLWVSSAGGGALKNINPRFSDDELRDFGRATAINNTGTVTARDRASNGVPDGFFVRQWDSNSDNQNRIVGSANNWLQPDFGTNSAVQTFTDVNDRGDVVFVGQSVDGGFRAVDVWRTGQPDYTEVATLRSDAPAPRPQLTADGRVLIPVENHLTLFGPGTISESAIQKGMGFSTIGSAPGITDDGNVVVFTGDRGYGAGVFISYRTATGWKTVPVAGELKSGWTAGSFDLTDAVRVTSTAAVERGVTVAFEATHPIVGHGIYTARVSFFGPSAEQWNPLDPSSVRVSAAVPVGTAGEAVGGGRIADVELWDGLNDNRRGELAFWVQLDTGGQQIVRATPTPVIWVDFTPKSSPPAVSGTAQNLALLDEVGLRQSGWPADFDAALMGVGLPGTTNFSQLRTTIVDKVQTYFDRAGVDVHVMGRPGDVPPAFIPQATLPLTSLMVDTGAFMTVQVGGAPASQRQQWARSPAEYLLGSASAPFRLAGTTVGTLDFFNQVQDDLAVVFGDAVLTQLKDGGYSPSTIPADALATGVARTIAHEAGHNYGLVHLDTAYNGDLMNARAETASELTAPEQQFDDAYVPTAQIVTASENSQRRLWFAVGGRSPGDPPPAEFLAIPQSRYSLGGSGIPPVAVRRLLVGLVSGGDTLPTVVDLGSGDLAALLATARVSASPGTHVLLLGSTDGAALDVIGVPVGQQSALSSLDLTQLGVVTDARLPTTVGTGPALELYQITPSGPVSIGSVMVQGIPAMSVSAASGELTAGGALGLGSTDRAGGALTQVLAIQNTGNATLDLGTVTATGAGYSATPPGSAHLAPGESTTLTVTLSDATAGAGIPGVLTIPTNLPSGAFVLTLRGDVIARPRAVGVTRLDNGTGPMVVGVDFSERLQPGPAGDARNFVVALAGRGIPLASAVYTEAGGAVRVTLTSSESGPFTPGQYEVRFDGAQLRSSSGTPVTAPSARLAVLVAGANGVATLGPAPAGGVGVDGPFTPLGAGPPRSIAGGDFTGDGRYDLVTASRETGELLFFYAAPEGGYDDPAHLPVTPARPGLAANPTSVMTADWNGDGHPDVVALDQSVDYTLGTSVNRVLVYLNDGRGRFTAAPDTPVPLNEISPVLLAVGDFVGGGPSEVVVGDLALAGEPAVGVYAKDPFLGYTRVAQLSTGQSGWYPNTAAAGDLNGDGRPDLVVATTGYYLGNPGVVAYLSTPDGLAAARRVDYDGSDPPNRVAIGDFTGDGKADLAFVHDRYRNSSGAADGAVITVEAGDGRGGLTELPGQALHRRGVTLAGAADLNGDGRLDLLLLAAPFEQAGFDATPELSAWPVYGTGTGAFTPGALTPIAAGGNLSPGNFVLGDLTGDGFPDAAYGNTTGGRIGLLTNDTTGTLRTGGPYGPTTGTYAEAYTGRVPGFLSADLNRDGASDLIRVANGVDVMLGLPGGGFRRAATLDTSPSGTSLRNVTQVGDLDRDGIPDLVAGGRVWFGRGDGTFRPGQEILRPNESDTGAGRGTLVDVNGDGNLDLVLTLTQFVEPYATPTGYGVYFGDGTGRLTFNPNAVVTVPRLQDVGEALILPPLVFDVTGDGVPDVVAAAQNLGTGRDELQVYPGRGNGTFAAAVATPVPPGVVTSTGVTLVPLDYDRDGVTDLAGFAWSDQVSFYRGLGGGAFAAGPLMPIGDPGNSRTVSAAAGDFDGDGNPDVMVGFGPNYVPPEPGTEVAFLRGDGAGQFSTSYIDVGGQSPVAVVGLTGASWITGGTVSQEPPGAPPANQSLSVATEQGKPVWVSPQAAVGVPRLIAVSTPPAHGVVRVDDNGTPTNAGDDRFVYTPAAGYAGQDGWSFVVGDAGGSATGQVAVTVTTATNTPPTISSVPDLQTTAGTTVGPVGFTIGDGETPAGSLVVTASSSNPSLVPTGSVVFGGGGPTRTVTVTPAAGQTGTALITLTVTDAGGLTATDAFVLTVTPSGGNTPPAIFGVPDQQTAVGVAVGPLVFAVADAETPPAGLVVTASSSNPSLVPTGSVVFGGGGPTRTVTVTPAAGQTGTALITLTVTDAGGLTAADAFVLTVYPGSRLPATLVGYREFGAGPDGGGPPVVTLYNPDATARFTQPVLRADLVGGVRTAAADLTGDGVADVVVGTGPGMPTSVQVLDGVTQQVLFAVAPFEAAFTGGVYVAAGDVDGDGVPELVITPDEGGGPRVQLYSGAGFAKIADFFGIDDPNFRGGARAAVGDLNGDGRGDLVVAAGFGGGPRVAVFDGRAVTSTRGKLFNDLFVFEPALRNGAFVAAGDVDGDGFADLVAGGGPGGGPRVLIRSGADLAAGNVADPRVLGNFFAGNVANRGGIRVSVKDLDGDARADLVVGDGTGAGSRVTGYLGKNLTGGSAPATFAFDAFPGLTGGVFVG